MSVKAVLNRTEYISIWYLCVKIYGPTYEDGYWRINMNQEVYTKIKSADSVIVIESLILKWLGHVVGMFSERKVKMLPEGKPGEGENKEDLEEDRWMMLNWT
jgi:hypothetical protein